MDEAVTHYEKALDIQPDFADTHDNLGVAFANREEVDEAIAQYQQALQIQPDYAEAHFNLGNVFANRDGWMKRSRIMKRRCKSSRTTRSTQQPWQRSSEKGKNGRSDHPFSEGAATRTSRFIGPK